jgi:sarcosine oxidase/L-pipecolate oxidase
MQMRIPPSSLFKHVPNILAMPGKKPSQSTIIIGAGVFGASSALHLARKDPSARIILIDRTPFPCPKAASHDVNKIVRADYADLFYCRLGLESLDVWRTDQIYKELYHESGMLSVYPSHGSDAENILKNFKELNANPNAEIISPEVMKKRFDGLYADACFDDVEHILWNPHSGWVQAVEALTATIKAAIATGVTYVSNPVSKLILDQGTCTGVEMENGQILTASRVLVCTGAGTAKLLADSAPKDQRLHVGDRFMAGGICEAVVKLTEGQVKQYSGAATILFDANTTKGMSLLMSRRDH